MRLWTTCKNSDEKRPMEAEVEEVQSLFQVSGLHTDDGTEFMVQDWIRWCTTWGTVNIWDWERDICYLGVKNCTRLNRLLCSNTTVCVKRRKESRFWWHTFVTVILELSHAHETNTHSCAVHRYGKEEILKGQFIQKKNNSVICSKPIRFSFFLSCDRKGTFLKNILATLFDFNEKSYGFVKTWGWIYIFLVYCPFNKCMSESVF